MGFSENSRPYVLLQVAAVIFALLAMGDGLWALASTNRSVSVVGDVSSVLAVFGAFALVALERRRTAMPSRETGGWQPRI